MEAQWSSEQLNTETGLDGFRRRGNISGHSKEVLR